jgi:hypothetical protein
MIKKASLICWYCIIFTQVKDEVFLLFSELKIEFKHEKYVVFKHFKLVVD